MLHLKKPPQNFRHLLASPIIYSVIVPLAICDLWFEIYHRICFPLYSLPYVKRKNYIKIDRHKLEYLDFYQKISCAFCGYANGLVNYWVKIGAVTEHYWCGIQHQKDKNFIPPEHHEGFVEYGDQEEFQKKYSNDK